MCDEFVLDWDCRGHARLQAMRLRSVRADVVVSVKERPAGPALAHTVQAGVGIKRELHQVLVGFDERACSREWRVRIRAHARE
jgi:hypothetical protein